MASSNAAVLLTWSDSGTIATVVTTGFSGSHSGRSGASATFGSNDGTFGANLAGAPTTAGTSFVKNNSTVSLTMTNNTGSAYSIDSLHWDLGVRNTSLNAFTVTYVSGGLGPASTVIDTKTGLAAQGSGSLFDAYDYDYTLSSFLADTTLEDGESAVFTFAFSGGSNNNSSIFDNIAFQGTLIPEPSSALLGGLGLLALLRRRR